MIEMVSLCDISQFRNGAPNLLREGNKFWDKKVWIGTLETTNPGYALWRKEEVLEWFSKLKNEQNLDMVILCVVDILNEINTTIVSNWIDADYLAQIFNTKVEANLADLWNRLSRKKQIVPVFQENIV